MGGRKVTWTWTNWTFGIWYGKFRRHRAWGVDVGPLEVVWRRGAVSRDNRRKFSRRVALDGKRFGRYA